VLPDRAVAMGLANRVVEAGQLHNEALALARRLADLPQHALRDTKRALNLVLEQNLAATRNYALAAERYSMADSDHTAFIERMLAKAARSS
jgi:Enoyl-CoA hydratase/carnithine racemase